MTLIQAPPYLPCHVTNPPSKSNIHHLRSYSRLAPRPSPFAGPPPSQSPSIMTLTLQLAGALHPSSALHSPLPLLPLPPRSPSACTAPPRPRPLAPATPGLSAPTARQRACGGPAAMSAPCSAPTSWASECRVGLERERALFYVASLPAAAAAAAVAAVAGESNATCDVFAMSLLCLSSNIMEWDGMLAASVTLYLYVTWFLITSCHSRPRPLPCTPTPHLC